VQGNGEQDCHGSGGDACGREACNRQLVSS